MNFKKLKLHNRMSIKINPKILYFLIFIGSITCTAMDIEEGMARITSYQDFIKTIVNQTFPGCTIVAYKVDSKSPFYSSESVILSNDDEKIMVSKKSFIPQVQYGLIWSTSILGFGCRPDITWYEFISLQDTDVPKKITTLKQCGIKDQMNGRNWFIINEDARGLINDTVRVLSVQDDLQMRALKFEEAKFLLDSLAHKKFKFPMNYQNQQVIKILKAIYRNQCGLEYGTRPQKIV